MVDAGKSLDIFVETSNKKVFVGVIEWPGWIRWGREEAQALEALFHAGPRYAAALDSTGLGVHTPDRVDAFKIVERHEGNATTAFGAPDAELLTDSEGVDEKELERFHTILQAGWSALDSAIDSAQGHELRKGPRGGGRSLIHIIDHLIMADKHYLKRIGWKVAKALDSLDGVKALNSLRAEILAGLTASAHGDLPTVGPRGGKRWTTRFFIRRVAWHTLDHAWEIEDRIPAVI